jgi:hypothetical protein
MVKYFYYEPRTGTFWDRRPERKNVYKIEATDENRARIVRQGEGLLAWLAENDKTEKEPASFEDRDWAALREAHDDLEEKLKNRSAYVDELSPDTDSNKAVEELLDDVEALVELVGKLVI